MISLARALSDDDARAQLPNDRGTERFADEHCDAV
jgi:hypothetical protein